MFWARFLSTNRTTVLAAVLVVASGVNHTAGAGPVTTVKDTGPVNALCDSSRDDAAALQACVGPAEAIASDEELFYAGYWLARTGAYQRALHYLTQAVHKDARILTYIGFARRKLGDVDEAFSYYRDALKLDPGYSVARAYLGEAFLAQGDVDHAKAQLDEIARRCGMACPEYADLAKHIDAYEDEAAGRGSG